MSYPKIGGMPFEAFRKLSDLDKVKQMLIDEKEIEPTGLHNELTFLSYTKQKGEISFQFCGWNIVLLEDGTWLWTDTTGG